METSTMIRQLRRTAKKHENDKLHTFDTNITAMCSDVANRLEELEKENKEIRAKAIDEFKDDIKAELIRIATVNYVDVLVLYEIMDRKAEQLKAGGIDG